LGKFPFKLGRRDYLIGQGRRVGPLGLRVAKKGWMMMVYTSGCHRVRVQVLFSHKSFGTGF